MDSNEWTRANSADTGGGGGGGGGVGAGWGDPCLYVGGLEEKGRWGRSVFEGREGGGADPSLKGEREVGQVGEIPTPWPCFVVAVSDAFLAQVRPPRPGARSRCGALTGLVCACVCVYVCVHACM
jgi:hypothetical protein